MDLHTASQSRYIQNEKPVFYIPTFPAAIRVEKMNQATDDVGSKFKALAEQWSQHCRSVMFSSNIDDYLNHPAYAQLVALGKPAIPFIMRSYLTDDLHWEFVLDDITGFHWIKDRHRFSPKLLKEQWLKWWDAQSDRS